MKICHKTLEEMCLFIELHKCDWGHLNNINNAFPTIAFEFSIIFRSLSKRNIDQS